MDKKSLSIVNKIKSFLGVTFGIMVYFAWQIAVYFFITGSITTRTIIVILLIYQFTFCKKSDLYLEFIRWLGPFSYFNNTALILEEPLKESKSLICYHPHGILAYGFAMTPGFSKTIYDCYSCVSSGLLYLPISGIFSRWMGMVSVEHKNFTDIMKKGNDN